MMLHGRDDDFVSGPDVPAAETLGDEVDALGGAADEDDFACFGRVDEALHLGARILVGLRGPLAEQVNAAMDVAALGRVKAFQGVEDRLRLLRGGRVVEIHQRPAVDLLPQDGKVGPDAAHVERPRRRPAAASFSNRGRLHSHDVS